MRKGNNACIITHPQEGMQVLVHYGESFEDAIKRYNETIMGWTPEDQTAFFELNPRQVPRYSFTQLQEIKSFGGTQLNDPDTERPISIDEYIAKYTKGR